MALASGAEKGRPQEVPAVQRRMAVTQGWASIPSLLLIALAFVLPWELDQVQGLLMLGGSLPLGLLIGFLLARRIASKADASGVYSWRVSFAAYALVIVVPVSFGMLAAFLLPLSTIASICYTFGGLGVTAPLGTILFERRTRSRLWIRWIPSQWWPERVEYHLEYHAGAVDKGRSAP